MRQLAMARRRPDGALRAELILAELLARHEPNIRRIVKFRTYSRQPSTADIDEIVNTVMIGVVKALKDDFDPEMPFVALVAKNTEWDVIDWVRAQERRNRDLLTDDVTAWADPAQPDAPSLVDEARRLHELIEELPPRDREMVSQRMLLGWDPKRIAAFHGVSRGVVDTATSRSLKKLAASPVVSAKLGDRGVRDRPPSSGNKT
jgi:RNA polymerase sigma factor (sigma-70 family)